MYVFLYYSILKHVEYSNSISGLGQNCDGVNWFQRGLFSIQASKKYIVGNAFSFLSLIGKWTHQMTGILVKYSLLLKIY